MAEHKHAWELHSRTTEEEAAGAPAPRVVPASLPVGFKTAPTKAHKYGEPKSGPHDPKNDEHVAALRAAGVENFDPPPARQAGEVYVCSCGAARHEVGG